MAGGAPAAVRQPLRVRARSHRTPDERLAIRFPWLARPVFVAFNRLAPSSRLRRLVAARTWRKAIEAYNRRDLEAVTIGFHPDAEYYPYREFVEAALADPVYRGPAGYRAYIDATQDVWGDEVRLEPTELIDLGDRFVLLADMPMRAQGSGIALTETYACVTTVANGRLIRQQDYLTHDEALREAGLAD
jgi:ketosteroid isomerase-like protein